MFIVISPSKTQDFSALGKNLQFEVPRMEHEIKNLVLELKKKSISDLKDLMGVSDKIAELNFNRYRFFENDFNEKNSKPAIFAFKGDVYSSIEVDRYSIDELNFLQKHLFILSGLYGVLSPLDLIQPYRLEMGTKLYIGNSKNLYEFWGDKITNFLNDQIKSNDILLNLASQEYYQAIVPERLHCKKINVIFKEKKGSDYKIIGLFAKKARGKMVHYIVKNKITELDAVKKFNTDGYRFIAEMSDSSNFVFVR